MQWEQRYAGVCVAWPHSPHRWNSSSCRARTRPSRAGSTTTADWVTARGIAAGLRLPGPAHGRFAHGRSAPSNITSVNNAPDPPLEHIATSAPVDLVGGARAAQLLDAADDALQQLHDAPRVAERHHPAVGGDGELPTGLDGAAHHEVAALALGAEPERLELADDLERERVVELAHVDVGRARGPPARNASSRRAGRRAVHEVGSPVAAEVPRRRVPVRGPAAVAVAAEHVHRGWSGGRRRGRRGSARGRSRPPTSVAQSRRWNGSATMRLSRTSWGVNGPRP